MTLHHNRLVRYQTLTLACFARSRRQIWIRPLRGLHTLLQNLEPTPPTTPTVPCPCTVLQGKLMQPDNNHPTFQATEEEKLDANRRLSYYKPRKVDMNPVGRPRRALDDDLIKRLFQAGTTEAAIARHVGVSKSSVHRRLVTMGVELRSAAQATALRCHNTFDIAPLRPLLDGLLLGDGSLELPRTSESRLEVTQRTACREWLTLIQRSLQHGGVVSRVTDRDQEERGHQLKTKKYQTFTEERRRWYPKNIKRIPANVCLTAESLAHWYWGDGTSDVYRMTFCTDGFSVSEVEFLIMRLHAEYKWETRWEYHPTKQGTRHPRLVVGRAKDRHALIEMIKPYCPPCFQYKLHGVNVTDSRRTQPRPRSVDA